MEKLIMNECRYCGKCFKHWVELASHEVNCDKLTIDESLKPDNIKPNHFNKGKKDLLEYLKRLKEYEEKTLG